MHTEKRFSPEDEQACDRLTPHVRRACDSVPPPAVLAAIHAAAERKVHRNRILPFIRFVAAAAAMLLVTMGGWLLIRSSMASENDRQAALMDDMLFLCAEDQPAHEIVAPNEKRADLARRLLNLQGLDATANAPRTETPAEPATPPSKESQSRNTPALQAQRCG